MNLQPAGSFSRDGELGCPTVKMPRLGLVFSEGGKEEFDWEEVYEKESPILYGYLIKKIGAQAAEDILQESFLRLIDMTQKKGGPQNVRAYLFQIARNLVFDSGIIAGRQTNLDEKASVFQHNKTGENELAQKEISEVLNASFQVLDTREAEVFDLRWNQGLSTDDIASIIKTSDRHVRRILDKGTRKIEAFFRQKGWEAEYVLSK